MSTLQTQKHQQTQILNNYLHIKSLHFVSKKKKKPFRSLFFLNHQHYASDALSRRLWKILTGNQLRCDKPIPFKEANNHSTLTCVLGKVDISDRAYEVLHSKEIAKNIINLSGLTASAETTTGESFFTFSFTDGRPARFKPPLTSGNTSQETFFHHQVSVAMLLIHCGLSLLRSGFIV